MRTLALAERLRKAGIDPEDMIDLVWVGMEATIEARVERLAKDVLRSLLRDLRLHSKVVVSSVDWAKESA